MDSPFYNLKRPVAFGGWQLGGQNWGPGPDLKTMRRLVDAAYDHGIRLFDTAPFYGNGLSEERLGAWLKYKPDAIIATKFGLLPKPGQRPAFEKRVDRPSLRQELGESLRRLQRSTLTLYQLHWPPTTWNDSEHGEAAVVETCTFMKELVAEGVVQWLGACNLSAHQCQTVSTALGSSFVSHQLAYSLIPETDQPTEKLQYESRQTTLALDKTLLCYAPLAKGLLSDTYNDEHPPRFGKGDHRRHLDYFRNPRYSTLRPVLTSLRALAHDKGVPTSTLALAWVMNQADNTLPIVGWRSVEQLEQTLGACELALSAQELQQMTALFRSAAVHEASPTP